MGVVTYQVNRVSNLEDRLLDFDRWRAATNADRFTIHDSVNHVEANRAEHERIWDAIHKLPPEDWRRRIHQLEDRMRFADQSMQAIRDQSEAEVEETKLIERMTEALEKIAERPR